jgi:prepilin-type N-terminal cleavage/methylation domain-containing protein
MWPSRAGRSFTLVELMVVVAVLAVLSSLAVGNYRNYKYKAARAELLTNVSGIRVAQQAYEAAQGVYVTDLTPRPDPTPGKAKRAWVTGTVFDVLAWTPDGEVFGSYTTEDLGTDFSANGYTDVDTDAVMAQVTGSLSVVPFLATPDAVF